MNKNIRNNKTLDDMMWGEFGKKICIQPVSRRAVIAIVIEIYRRLDEIRSLIFSTCCIEPEAHIRIIFGWLQENQRNKNNQAITRRHVTVTMIELNQKEDVYINNEECVIDCSSNRHMLNLLCIPSVLNIIDWRIVCIMAQFNGENYCFFYSHLLVHILFHQSSLSMRLDWLICRVHSSSWCTGKQSMMIANAYILLLYNENQFICTIGTDIQASINNL